MGAKAPILHSTTPHLGSREPRPSPPGCEKLTPLALVHKIKGPSSSATRLQDPQSRKPSRLSTKSRVQAAPHLRPSSPANRLQDPPGRNPPRLSTESRVQAAPRLAPGSPKARNPRPCRRNQGPRPPEQGGTYFRTCGIPPPTPYPHKSRLDAPDGG